MIAFITSSFNVSADITLNFLNGLPTVGNQSISPTRSVSASSESTSVSYSFSNALLIPDDLHEGCYMWEIPGFNNNCIKGQSGYPFIIDSFEIPNGKNPVLTITSQSSKTFSYSMAPARPLKLESDDLQYTSSDVTPITQTQDAAPVRIIGIDYYRGHKIARVLVSPAISNGYRQTTKAYLSISYTISYKDAPTFDDGITPKQINDNILGSIVLGNYSVPTIQNSTTLSVAAPKYLILTTNALSKAANTFAEWKKTLGFNTSVITQSSWTANAIKSTLMEAYGNSTNLTYVLLLGNNTLLPTTTSSIALTSYQTTQVYSDYPYSCLDSSNDDNPDVYLGRMPASNLSEAETIINKVISYEKNPPASNSFYKNYLVASYFYSDNKGYEMSNKYIECCEKINQGMEFNGYEINRIYSSNQYLLRKFYSDGSALPNELQPTTFSWQGNANDINNQLNNGCFLAMHRDHGEFSGWTYPSYQINNLKSLSNEALQPVVFSINCSSGNFVYDCFASNMLSMSKGGCVGIIAATDASYTAINNIFAPGLFKAIWPDSSFGIEFDQTGEPVYRLGQILRVGYAAIDQNNPFESGYGKYQKYIYHCLGDPSMRIYTQKPAPIRVNGNTITIPANSTVSNYNIKTGVVMVSYTKDVISTQLPLASNDLIITISAPNTIPYIIKAGYNVTSTDETEQKFDMECYNNGCNVNISYATSEESVIEISDLSTGQIKLSMEVIPEEGGFLSLENIGKGIYIVSMTSESGERVSKKLIIK